LLETQGLDHLGAVAALTHHEPWSAEAPLAVELVKVAAVFDQRRLYGPIGLFLPAEGIAQTRISGAAAKFL
jgi:hypothetical protein